MLYSKRSIIVFACIVIALLGDAPVTRGVNVVVDISQASDLHISDADIKKMMFHAKKKKEDKEVTGHWVSREIVCLDVPFNEVESIYLKADPTEGAIVWPIYIGVPPDITDPCREFRITTCRNCVTEARQKLISLVAQLKIEEADKLLDRLGNLYDSQPASENDFLHAARVEMELAMCEEASKLGPRLNALDSSTRLQQIKRISSWFVQGLIDYTGKDDPASLRNFVRYAMAWNKFALAVYTDITNWHSWTLKDDGKAKNQPPMFPDPALRDIYRKELVQFLRGINHPAFAGAIGRRPVPKIATRKNAKGKEAMNGLQGYTALLGKDAPNVRLSDVNSVITGIYAAFKNSGS